MQIATSTAKYYENDHTSTIMTMFLLNKDFMELCLPLHLELPMDLRFYLTHNKCIRLTSKFKQN